MHHFGQANKALLNGIRDRHQRRGRAEDGEEKAVCIGLPHKVHTVPVVSVRLRVALYFVNIFPAGQQVILCLSLTQQVEKQAHGKQRQYWAMWYILAHPEKVKSLISMNNGIFMEKHLINLFLPVQQKEK
jgi:hypothetical protein